MNMVLHRQWLTELSTIGEITIDGQHACFTLEDRYRPPPEPKVPHQTCIPLGRYEVVITHSPRFGIDMPLLLNVPGFSGVRIHSGNKPEDTDGCVLVGSTRGPNQVLGSRIAYEVLFQKIQAARSRGENVFIDIRLEPQP